MTQFIKKIVHGIQKDMLREKMFRGKYLFKVIGTTDESSWKAYHF